MDIEGPYAAPIVLEGGNRNKINVFQDVWIEECVLP